MSEVEPDTVAEMLLYDINVEIGKDYPISTRDRFSFFQPFFRRNADLPLHERFVGAYSSLDEDARVRIRLGVVEALRRCAMQWLGLWRSLEVFDLHQVLAPEAFSTSTARGLLCLRNPVDPEDRAAWLDLLLRRWSAADLVPDVPADIWVDVVKDVRLEGLLSTVRYVVYRPLKWTIEGVQCLEMAAERFRQTPFDGRADALLALDVLLDEILPGDHQPSAPVVTSFDLEAEEAMDLNALEQGLAAKGWGKNVPDEVCRAEQAFCEALCS